LSLGLLLYLNPASVKFAEDLPAAGRCKVARVQTYYDISTPCQRRRLSSLHSDSPPGGSPVSVKSALPKDKLFSKTVYVRIQIGACHTGATFL